MTYTTHGHFVDGSPWDSTEARPRVHRCGGPGNCGKCSSEAAIILNKIRARAREEVAQNWHRKPTPVQALYWDGEVDTAEKIVLWANENLHIIRSNFNRHYNQIELETFGTLTLMKPTQWLVYSVSDGWTLVDDPEFRENYELDNN